MAQKIFQIAVDGPSGAGKSTIAKAVARIRISIFRTIIFSSTVKM